MCSISFYTNNDYDGSSITYSDPQGKESGVMSGIDSLKTGDNTWVVVYDSQYYGGNWMKIPPNTNHSDLKKMQRGSDSDDNWKNQIDSFVMYSSKPSFWDGSGAKPSFGPSSCHATFFENTSYKGDNKSYLSTTSKSSLGDEHYTTDGTKSLKNTINSLETGPQTWLVIYDAESYQGNSKKVNPNTTCSDLNNWTDRGEGGGDWKNQIQSFQLYSQKPTDWDVYMDINHWEDQYPNNYDDSTLSGNAMGYKTQNCQYRFYDPQISFGSNNVMSITFQIDHIMGGATDDHVTLVVDVNPDGSLNSTSYSWDAGGAYEIPNSVVKAVDAGVELAGAVGALETCGISEEAAQDFVETFDMACKVFNKIASVMANWAESDGGRFYLIPVIAHTINRALSSVTLNGSLL